MTDEIALAGGMGSGGAVVRVGDTVRRPVRPFSASVAAFLRHLEAVGFEGAPRHLGLDEQGREVLTFIEGTSGRRPIRRGSADERAPPRRRAAPAGAPRGGGDFVPPPDAHWDRPNLHDVGPGALVCHNDLCVENVVVRDGQVVAFIDFDFAAPSDPLLDIAIAARHWIPMRDPADIAPELAGPGPASRGSVPSPTRTGWIAPVARRSWVISVRSWTARSSRCAGGPRTGSRRTSAHGRAATRSRTAGRGPGWTNTRPISPADAHGRLARLETAAPSAGRANRAVAAGDPAHRAPRD